MTSSVVGATTVYYTPYNGWMIPLYNGVIIQLASIQAELSQLTTDATKSPAAVAANSVYDMFVWMDAGNVRRLSRGPAWTNPTTRSMALARAQGVLTNGAAITNGPAINRGLYVGTIASNASSTIDWIYGGNAIAGVHNVWNMYNRVNVGSRVVDTQVAYTYSSNVIRQAGGSVYNQISYVNGLGEDSPIASYQQTFTTAAAAGAFCKIGVGDDTLTVFETMPQTFSTPAAVAFTCSTNTTYQKGGAESLIGVHYVAALEAGDNVNLNTFNVGQLGELSFSMMM